MSESARLYYCANIDRFEQAMFENEYFLFNPYSGETHLLNQQAMWMLESLARQPASASTLIDTLPKTEGSESPLDLHHAIEFQLEQLRIIGLVEHWDDSREPR